MTLDELIGESPPIAAVRERVARVLVHRGEGGRMPPVLIQGETGTGKGLVARALHAASSRRAAPFVDVNCAAIPESLLEAEMFGVERGAFTGADRARPGLFQSAHRGTLFLDEIGLVPEALQSKLLKALEQRMVRRLGRATGEPVDVWIVAATSEDLDAAMQTGRFRRDLYHRLAVLTLRLPPLRERGADVPLLAAHFLARACDDYRLPHKAFAEEASRALRAHRWPGNVRELANAVERAALLSEGAVVTEAELGLGAQVGGAPVAADTARGALRTALEEAERERVLEALEQTAWNLSHAAARLGVPRNTLRYRMERLGLRPSPPSRRRPAAPAPPAGGENIPDRPAAREPTAPDPPAIPAAPVVRRRLSWLRVDLAGATSSAPEFDTNRALEAIAEKVESFGGAIQLLHRARVLAVFGLEPIEDAPRRTALTALAVQRAAEVARRENAWPWRVALGVHVHDCALESRGATMAVAAESRGAAEGMLEALLDAAPPDAVLISAAAAPFLERRFELAPVARAADERAFRLTGPERIGFGVGGRVTEFAGRRQELGLLQGRLAAAAGGRGHVVALIGEAGIGKSRLLFELRHGPGMEDVGWFEGRCHSHAGAVPYVPVVALVREVCAIAEGDAAATIESKLDLTLARLGVPAPETLPYLLQLLGVPQDRELRGVNPALLKARTIDAVRHVALAAGRARRSVLVLEDLHWIDRTSDELLSALVDSMPTAALLLVATYRPGYQPAWLARSYVTQMALAPLSRDESRTVLGSALGRARVAPAVADAVVAKADGNPFFLEELARAIGEGDGSSGVDVPDTIQSVLMARIDRLAETDRQLLQSAAILGRDVDVALLGAVAEDEESALLPRLKRLQAAEFLDETRPAPRLEYAFKHALTHEVAYASLPPEQRRALHARAAHALAGASPAADAREPEIIAGHLTAAGLSAEAIVYWLRAGERAIRRSAPVEAAHHLRVGLELMARLPEGRERDGRELELQLALGPALVMAAGYGAPDVQRVYARARALAQGLAEIPRLISACVGALGFHLVRGDQRAARESAEELLAIASRAGNAELLVEAHFAVGVSLHYRGHFDEARAQLSASVALYDPGRDAGHAFAYGQDPRVGCLCYLAYGRALQGHEAEALRHLEAALRGAEELDHAFTRGCALHFAALVHELRGDFGAAREYAEREIGVAREHRFPFWLAGGTHMRGRVAAVEGRLAEGAALMREALGVWRATGAALALPYYLSHLADAHLAAGELAAGLAVIDEALAIADDHDERNYAAELHRLRGALLAADGAADGEAEAAFAQAVSLATRQRSRVLARRAAASLAGHLRARGRAAEAERMLAELDEALAEGPP